MSCYRFRHSDIPATADSSLVLLPLLALWHGETAITALGTLLSFAKFSMSSLPMPPSEIS